MKRILNGGFSLIELMIVVAIVAILVGIAYPSYTNSILKGNRGEARTALAELLQQEERYMTQNNCYLGFTTSSGGVATPSAPSPSTACGGVTAASAPFKAFSGQNLSNSKYLMSAGLCPDGSGGTLAISDCVQVIATPIPSTADPAAGVLQMTSTGTKDCTGTSWATQKSVCWP